MSSKKYKCPLCDTEIKVYTEVTLATPKSVFNHLYVCHDLDMFPEIHSNGPWPVAMQQLLRKPDWKQVVKDAYALHLLARST
jgi:hypothetical protein